MKKIIFSVSNPPTKEYVFTRHNVGRLFIENFLIKKISCTKTISDKYTKYEFKSHPNLIVCTS
jgi:peptidyl-tRNA hydrolase